MDRLSYLAPGLERAGNRPERRIRTEHVGRLTRVAACGSLNPPDLPDRYNPHGAAPPGGGHGDSMRWSSCVARRFRPAALICGVAVGCQAPGTLPRGVNDYQRPSSAVPASRSPAATPDGPPPPESSVRPATFYQQADPRHGIDSPGVAPPAAPPVALTLDD